MPEFHLDCGTKHVQYRALDEFTQGYFECAFFCGLTEDCDVEKTRHAITLDMLSAETWDRMVRDCNDFQIGNEAALAGACSAEIMTGRKIAQYTMRQAGIDFWFSRNGHAGYFERGLPDDIEQTLEEAATCAGQYDLYLGNDGDLYGYPPEMPTAATAEAAT